MTQIKKTVIFAPFWRQPNHVGNYRIDRFVRWLMEDGFYVVLIRAGSEAGRSHEPWGVEITIRDPLGLYRDDAAIDGTPVTSQEPRRLRRQLAYWLLNPDPSIIWSRIAANNQDVLEPAKGASFVISSSPPESAHIGASILAKKLKTKFVVDMRDGWLDEPLRPLLRKSRLRRWREIRLEKSILRQADQVFVSSPAWKTLLINRLPFTQDKTTVLTNACPSENLFKFKQSRKKSASRKLKLVHAGRFTGSMSTRHIGLLFEPLLSAFKKCEPKGVIVLLGDLKPKDLNDVESWREQFAHMGWSIEIKAVVPRDEMMKILDRADGLLLLAEKKAAIPAKFYEYLITKKPVLAVTPTGGAVWSIGESLPQLFMTDHARSSDNVVLSFLFACSNIENHYKIPFQFTEESLSHIFIRDCKKLLDVY